MSQNYCISIFVFFRFSRRLYRLFAERSASTRLRLRPVGRARQQERSERAAPSQRAAPRLAIPRPKSVYLSRLLAARFEGEASHASQAASGDARVCHGLNRCQFFFCPRCNWCFAHIDFKH